MAAGESSQFNIHDAKTNFSRLVERAEKGEEITISRAGRPVAKLVPLQASGIPRRRGLWRGRVVIHDDFDELPEDIASAFAARRREVAAGHPRAALVARR